MTLGTLILVTLAYCAGVVTIPGVIGLIYLYDKAQMRRRAKGEG